MERTPDRPTALSVVAGSELRGLTCAVTGATGGLGLESARALAVAGARVLLLGRSTDGLRAAATSIRAVAPGADLVPVELDLGSLASVGTAAGVVRGATDRLDVLMNNAGVMCTPFGRTADGFETQVGVNHLGHFALTHHLMPLLLAAPAARVVNLSSEGHVMADADLGDLNWHARDYDKFAAYGASKTANILFTVGLRARFGDAGPSAFAVHPGVVATSLGRHLTREDFSAFGSGGSGGASGSGGSSGASGSGGSSGASGGGSGGGRARLAYVRPEEGAATQVWAAVAPGLARDDPPYLSDLGPAPKVRSYAVDPTRAEALWDLSTGLCGL